MNRRLSKRIRRHAEDIQLAWVKSLLSDDEANKVDKTNLAQMLPTQTHVWGMGTKYCSVFGMRHVTKKLKQLLRLFPDKAVEDLTLADVNWKIQQRKG